MVCLLKTGLFEGVYSGHSILISHAQDPGLEQVAQRGHSRLRSTGFYCAW